MIYDVSATGTAVLKKGVEELPESVLDTMYEMFSGFSYTKENNRVLYHFEHEYSDWKREEVLPILNSMLPYIDECTVDCEGEDKAQWQILLHNGEWITREGYCVYDGVYGKFDIALLEKPLEDGLTKKEILSLLELLTDDESYPMEIPNDHCGVSSAMGFITANAAEKIDYLYDKDSDIGKFIMDILGDVNLETTDHTYNFQGLKIKITQE